MNKAASFNPVAPEYRIPPASTEGSEAWGGEFKTATVIGPFEGVGDVLSPTIELFKNNIWLITKVVFVIFAPFEIFKALSFGPERADWQFGMGLFGLSLLCKALVAPSLIYALVTVMRTGVAPSLSESYRWGLSRLGKLVVCALLAWVLQILGFVCLIVPGIILGLAFELVYPMAALENRSPVEILKRSYELTKGYRWKIFGAVFVLGLLCSVISIPVGFVLGMLATGGINLWPLQAAVSMVTDIIYEATTVLSLVIYFSILSSHKAQAGWHDDHPL